MATTTDLLPHPTHEHPLKLVDFSSKTDLPSCDLCCRVVSTEAYTCQEGCEYVCHRLCAEAPPRIQDHPLHPAHSLTLIHRSPTFVCSACDWVLDGRSAFRCDDCDFILDLYCALATLLDQGGFSEGTVPEQIVHPFHPHPLTFSARNNLNFTGYHCSLCKGRVRKEAYRCLYPTCNFIIHKRCVQDLYWTDGTKAPHIYHEHQLEIFVAADDTGSTKCASCGSGKSGKFIGCSSCQIFYHMDCIQGPEVLQYPPHQHNSLVLYILFPDDLWDECKSCMGSTKGQLCYYCPYCSGFCVHVGCALQTVAYCEEGMRASIEYFWHEHPLFLCDGIDSGWRNCNYCGDKSIGPTYACQEGCPIQLHERCIKFEYTISHYLHPAHPLTFATGANGHEHPLDCPVCQLEVHGFSYTCNICAFYVHARCAIRPILKHCLHEHKLLRLDTHSSMECKRCSTGTNTPLLRCAHCNFNLHEKCMELPLVIKSDIHWHPLTLHETYIEDEYGEYYCDHCEKSRDTRLGAYVCGQCPARWAYHIECVLPELKILFAKESKTSDIKAWNEKIEIQNERVREAEEKLEETKRVLDEMKLELEKLISEEQKNSIAATEKID